MTMVEHTTTQKNFHRMSIERRKRLGMAAPKIIRPVMVRPTIPAEPKKPVWISHIGGKVTANFGQCAAFEKPVTSITIRQIQKAVSLAYAVPMNDLLGYRRSVDLIVARHMAMALAFLLTKGSFPEIARHFSRDHTTVLHAKQKFNGIIEALRPHAERVSLDELVVMGKQLHEQLFPRKASRRGNN